MTGYNRARGAGTTGGARSAKARPGRAAPAAIYGPQPRLPHDDIVAEIADRAVRLGLLAHYCTHARTCKGTRGFPDLLVAGQHGLMLVEVKTDGDDTTAWQDLWRWTLTKIDGLCDGACERSGVLYLLARQADLADGGRIDQHLAAIA